jgi:hypothetical protein
MKSMFDVIIISLLVISIVINVILFRKLSKLNKSNTNKLIDIIKNNDKDEKEKLWGEFRNK